MTENTSSSLIVVLNSNKELEYFRDRELSDKQIEDLNKIDSKLANGFEVSGQLIKNPSPQDKATFIANLLIEGLIINNEPTVALCCSYLATRFIALKQIRATINESQLTIRLIYDQEYLEEATVQFISKKDLN